MQDKIILAIDALASAAFIEGGVSPENTQAARDLTEQRKHELAQAISSPCLLQIQEPPTKTEALAHYSQQAILAMGEAAHAAVAVPDEREEFKDHIKTCHNYFEGMLANSKHDNGFKVIDVNNQWIGWQARAALVATPAAATSGATPYTSGAPAQVVLPEPVVIATSKRESLTKGSVEFTWGVDALKDEGEHKLYTEQQVCAMVAAAPTPPAQERKQKYRLLERGVDLIERADEFLMDDGVTWETDPKGVFVGMKYQGDALLPARRPLGIGASNAD